MLTLSLKPHIYNSRVVVLQTKSKKYAKVRAARAAILFFSTFYQSYPSFLALSLLSLPINPSHSPIDLFSSYVLFSHFRPRDATRGNSSFQMSSDARANVRITNDKHKRQIPMRASRGLKSENKMYKLKRSNPIMENEHPFIIWELTRGRRQRKRGHLLKL